MYACMGSSAVEFSLDGFRSAVQFMALTHGWMQSHTDDPDQRLVDDGAAALLHNDMEIRSLLWYPFLFRGGGFSLLVLNHSCVPRANGGALELEFLDACARVWCAQRLIASSMMISVGMPPNRHAARRLSTVPSSKTRLR